MKSSVIMGGKSSEHERHNLDFYPTPPECTIALLYFLRLETSKIIWEPACGEGHMSRVISSHGHRTLSSDLRETGFGIGNTDFLKLSKPLLLDGNKPDGVITNPPFKVAAKFIHKCLYFDLHFYAMLLKSQYWHAENRKRLFMKTKPSFVLPLTWRPNFAPERGDRPTMEMAWTVWIRGEHVTRYHPLSKPANKFQGQLFN